ncbi:hypothetical protein [Streptomyces sp. NPDC056160]|uniref:hypothetical protein n=1 Tax=Streptomyces sp. NPDC056160 TaxID=3345731 RepID=UPI0035DC95A8
MSALGVGIRATAEVTSAVNRHAPGRAGDCSSGAHTAASSASYHTTSGTGVRTAGFGQTLLTASAKRFCGIKWVSPVEQDWSVKGAHINLKNGREVWIYADHDNKLAGRPITVTAGLATQAEIDAMFEAIEASSALRADFIAKATEAMNIMNTPSEKGGNWGMAQNTGAEMARLIRLLVLQQYFVA